MASKPIQLSLHGIKPEKRLRIVVLCTVRTASTEVIIIVSSYDWALNSRSCFKGHCKCLVSSKPSWALVTDATSRYTHIPAGTKFTSRSEIFGPELVWLIDLEQVSKSQIYQGGFKATWMSNSPVTIALTRERGKKKISGDIRKTKEITQTKISDW